MSKQSQRTGMPSVPADDDGDGDPISTGMPRKPANAKSPSGRDKLRAMGKMHTASANDTKRRVGRC